MICTCVCTFSHLHEIVSFPSSHSLWLLILVEHFSGLCGFLPVPSLFVCLILLTFFVFDLFSELGLKSLDSLLFGLLRFLHTWIYATVPLHFTVLND